MVKALLNSINNIPNTTAQLNSAASDNVSKTDFEKLFDKQQSLASNDKRPEDNTKDDDEESSEKAVSPNDTFAGSVAYDIRQLIAFLKSAGDDTSSNTEETEVQDIDGTETLDADEITKKLLKKKGSIFSLKVSFTYYIQSLLTRFSKKSRLLINNLKLLPLKYKILVTRTRIELMIPP